MTAGMVLVIGAALVHFVTFDRDGLMGVAIGTGVGLLNMAVSYTMATRALKQGMTSAMATLMGGFFARLIVLVVLLFWFQKLAAVDAVAFALSFMMLFFMTVAIEIQLVDRTLSGNGGTA
jgi:hypothetical protein